ncbi:arogenate dehydratase/prephenate dehydratase 6, chloroplastic-like [Prosopis cineraria]|uniref:arogenate dehydratase/prephenate dehydratase 6, chloroplastic-like n=1 Tax=Prosopis cineraria TaxID=364024 RepID=UPI00240FBF5B|nr:arogenate dehydratase/prephenate dehydratase 6, chloroplastic-like [Prosopis cineraria]
MQSLFVPFFHNYSHSFLTLTCPSADNNHLPFSHQFDVKCCYDFKLPKFCDRIRSCHVVDGKSSSSTILTSKHHHILKPLTMTNLNMDTIHNDSPQLRVAYQGVPGAYSKAAANKAYPDCKAIPYDQFEVAFKEVEQWKVDRAIIPLENSLGGSIHHNYDLLFYHNLHIIGEVYLPVHHCLLALPGVRKENLTQVISHPQALAQCEHTLKNKLGLNVIYEAMDNTANAAKFVAANNLRNTAAIASSRAAKLYGLQVMVHGIQDNPKNVTRFVILARELKIPHIDKPFKTSIVIALDKGMSLLFKVLSVFALMNINLTKIELRPYRNIPIKLRAESNNVSNTSHHFKYLLYIDFEASIAEVRAQNALTKVQELTSFLRVFGSYPMDMTPLNPACHA